MSAASNYTVDPQDLFYRAIKSVFSSWTALQLAITHDFAGSDTKGAAEWFLNATHQYVSENNDLEDFELEEFFDDTMNNEFNTIIDDGSSLNIAKQILNIFNMYKCGQQCQLTSFINDQEAKSKNVKSNVVKSSAVKQGNQEDTSSDDDEENEEDNPMEGVEPVETHEPKRNQLTADECKQIEQMDDGWTWVGKSGKHFTKNGIDKNQNNNNDNNG